MKKLMWSLLLLVGIGCFSALFAYECGGDLDCELTVFLMQKKRMTTEQIDRWLPQYQNNYHKALVMQKNLCKNICEREVAEVELEHAKQILGPSNNVEALKNVLFGQPEFSAKGWIFTIKYLCKTKDEVSKQEQKTIEKFFKEIEKRLDKDTLPIFNLSSFSGGIYQALDC